MIRLRSALVEQARPRARTMTNPSSSGAVSRLGTRSAFALALLFAAPARGAAQDGAPKDGAPAAQESDDDRAALATLATSVARGKLGGATARELDDYLKDFPDSPRALLLRAEVRRRTGRYEESAADFDHARRGCNEPALRRDFAAGAFELHFELGDAAACAADLDFVQDGTDPADDAALPLHARRLLLLLDLGQKKEANELYAVRFKDARKEAAPRVALEYGRALTALRDLDRAAQILVPVEGLGAARAGAGRRCPVGAPYRWTRAGRYDPGAWPPTTRRDPTRRASRRWSSARTRLLRWRRTRRRGAERGARDQRAPPDALPRAQMRCCATSA